MKARLILVNPGEASEPPLAPYLALEKDGIVGIWQAGWTWRLPSEAIEKVTPEDIRGALRVRPDDSISLSPVREVPGDDLMSPEMLRWAQEWWAEFVAELKQREPVAQAS